jgi:hypothetical protein
MLRPANSGLVALALFVASGSSASAQPTTPAGPFEGKGRAYLAATVALPWSQGVSDTEGYSYPPPPGGLSLGWSLLGGVFASDRVSVEFEVSRTGTVSREGLGRSRQTYEVRRRETFLSPALRFHLRPREAVDIEPVMAVDLVRGSEWEAFEDARLDERSQGAAGVSAGVDFCVSAGHAALVAMFRVHRTAWRGGDYDDEKGWTVRPGLGVRVTF